MSDAYTVLARRYRSQTFDELVGQEAIAQTLKNAIRTNHLAHAFLFTGTRGVGKTSAARILAKAVNCTNRAADGNPCGECNSCQAIARGEDFDVIEIDGASNNGVDNIRQLREAAGIRPARSAFKIYVIDEVHMVTTQAFNALLKTLEEPPEHVKFIFATTEVGKVPATILSRCQRFDFKPIPLPRIAEHLTGILKEEGVQADADAVFRIARLGAGSMRDALSILDRILSMGEKHITDRILEELLGKPPTQAIGSLVEAIANGDAGAAITRADGLLKEGMGVEQILSELVDFLRNLMVVAACGAKTELLEVAGEARALYTGLAEKFDAPTLVHLIALTEQVQRSVKTSTMQRPLFDALIVRMALSEQFSAIRQILATTETAQTQANPQIAGQKKTEIAPGGAGEAAVRAGAVEIQKQLVTPPPQAAAGDSAAGNSEGDEGGEENIYEVMKDHMRRQKEELEAKNAAVRQAARGGGRPGPQGSAAGNVPVKAVIEKITDFADAAGVWARARAWLEVNARSLETMMGDHCRIGILDVKSGETQLIVPQRLNGYANEKARLKLEEALRAVTGLGIRLGLQFVEEEKPVAGAEHSRSGVAAPSHTSQRVPAEVVEAVKQQKVVQELMKKLDANVVSIEMLGTGDAE